MVATKETGEPNHHGITGGGSLWYRWTAPASGSVTIDLCGSNFDTVLAVYTGSAVNGLSALAGDDDSGCGLASMTGFEAASGVTYRIAVDGYHSSRGTFELQLGLDRGEGEPTEPPPPPPPTALPPASGPSPPSPPAPSADTSPPDTAITKGPRAHTRKAVASFRFASSEAAPRFECALDGRAFDHCEAPVEVRVGTGRHALRVRAIDTVGNVDLTPAKHAWVRRERARR